MRPWMLALAIALMFGGACKKKGGAMSQGPRVTWSGIGEDHACEWTGDRGFCIADHKRYDCVREETKTADGCDIQSSKVVCLEKVQDSSLGK